MTRIGCHLGGGRAKMRAEARESVGYTGSRSRLRMNAMREQGQFAPLRRTRRPPALAELGTA